MGNTSKILADSNCFAGLIVALAEFLLPERAAADRQFRSKIVAAPAGTAGKLANNRSPKCNKVLLCYSLYYHIYTYTLHAMNTLISR